MASGRADRHVARRALRLSPCRPEMLNAGRTAAVSAGSGVDQHLDGVDSPVGQVIDGRWQLVESHGAGGDHAIGLDAAAGDDPGGDGHLVEGEAERSVDADLLHHPSHRFDGCRAARHADHADRAAGADHVDRFLQRGVSVRNVSPKANEGANRRRFARGPDARSLTRRTSGRSRQDDLESGAAKWCFVDGDGAVVMSYDSVDDG